MVFHSMRVIDDKREMIKNLRMRIQFAEINLGVENLENEYVYNALSHLAMIDKLSIQLHYYENLRVYPNSKRLNVDVLKYTEELLECAKQLLNALERGDSFEVK